jgi:hypothetical protein
MNYRLSFGGPIERSIRLDRQGRLTVQLLATAPGGAAHIPLVDVPVRIANETVRTDRQGRAVVGSLDPGTYTVSLAPDALSPNYELEGARTRKVEVGPGEFARTEYRSTAWSSLYAVTWSDPDGTGQLPPSAYTPLPGLKVEVQGLTEGTTDASGGASFTHLKPGRYKIILVPASVPHGLVSTTPASQEVELRPGQEAVISFGLQGFGHLAGTVSELAPRSGAASHSLSGIPVLSDGKAIGESGEGGTFDLRIPAGKHKITLDPNVLTASRYVVNGPLGVEVGPDQRVAQPIVVASYGHISVHLVQRGADGKMKSAAIGGAVVNFSGQPAFLYTDEKGQAAFDRLEVGKYVVQLDASSLPKEWALASPPSVPVNLMSGERTTVDFQVRPRSQ